MKNYKKEHDSSDKMKKFTIFYEISPNKFLEEIYNEIINLIVMLFKCRLQTQCTQTKNARYICN